jgi:hypothetical protein
VLDEVIEAAEADTAAKAKADKPVPPRIDPKTPIGDLLICHVEVLGSTAGGCPEGYVVTRNDPLALAAPEAFAPLADHLAT